MKKDYGFECDWCGKTLCEDPENFTWRVLNRTAYHFCSRECENICASEAPEVFLADDDKEFVQ